MRGEAIFVNARCEDICGFTQEEARGTGWLRFLHKGDYLNFLGIGILALVTAVCYPRIVPMLFNSGERLHGALAMLQVLVLLAAASGFFLVGGH